MREAALWGASSLPADRSLLMIATISGTIRHFLLPYAEHFRGLGWRVEAAANGASSDAVLRDAFDAVHELPLSRSIRDVAGIVRSEQALADVLGSRQDIVHVHTPIAAFLTRYAVSRLPTHLRPAVVYTAHGFHFHGAGRRVTNAAFLTAERVAGRWTDRLVVINDEDEEAARRHRIVPRQHLVRMPGIGIDTAVFAPDAVSPDRAADVRERLEIASDAPLFAVMGELNRNKRQRDAIAALAAMRNTNACLVLLGNGVARAALEATVSELGLEDRVHFLGYQQDVRPVVRASNAVILPSAREGLARSVMEALSLEVPVIASTARGNRELVGSDGGFIFPTGDVAALTAAMDRIAEHPDEAHVMGRRGRERMVVQYDLRVLIGMHEDLYRDMLAERSRPTR
jgi:glycosyltransferase involved in cell wall biosynthesis